MSQSNQIFKKILTIVLLSLIVFLTLTDACLKSEDGQISAHDTISVLSDDVKLASSNVFEHNNEVPCAHACHNRAADICCAGIVYFGTPVIAGADSSAIKIVFDYNRSYQLIFLSIPTPPPSILS
jgi:ABC-type cobalt transport system substrate-binding protein